MPSLIRYVPLGMAMYGNAHVLGIALNEMYGSSPHPMENIETLI